MDRKGKQKIGYVVTGTILLLSIFGILFAGRIKYEEKLREQQRQELEFIYPELQEYLEENFDFYQKKSVSADVWFTVMISITVIFFCFGFFVFFRLEQKEQMKQRKEELHLLYEQLQRYLCGDFQQRSTWDISDDASEEWLGICEKMAELDHYFSDMQQRLLDEENHTKALITDISHQLKTPLASIRMCHELSGAQDLTGEEREEFSQTEAREIQKLELLLNELVKLSRLENHMIQIKTEKADLRQTITEAVSQMFMKAYEKQIEISVEMEQEIEVLHDRKWTVEALVNILENAVKYSEQNTGIAIRVQCLPAHILVEVEDEGIGISEEELHKIFHRFYRGEEAKKRVQEGAGVGLYLARSIIEQQGGTILAKRRAEKGSRFMILFPAD